MRHSPRSRGLASLCGRGGKQGDATAAPILAAEVSEVMATSLNAAARHS